MKQKNDIVSFFRGIAIFTIVIYHLIQTINTDPIIQKVAAFGGAGVHIFILCSGFGLYLSYLQKPINYITFLKKRLSRIYYPYIIIVILMAIHSSIQYNKFPLNEVLSHIFLYKMFSTQLDTSICYPFWFISTIIQFYIAWPLIVKIIQHKRGYIAALVISILYMTIVAVLKYSEFRVWNSFFLQYLWEFCLGMWIAEQLYTHNIKNSTLQVKYKYLIITMIIGIGLTGISGWKGGILKIYNDIFSLLGYSSCLCIIYRIGINTINRFFIWTSTFSYEIYLLHILIFSLMMTTSKYSYFVIVLCIPITYFISWGYSQLLKIIYNTQIIK